jgi:hypothetical protein
MRVRRPGVVCGVVGMTVAVAVTLAIAVAGGCRWIWVQRRSRPRLRVECRATWIPEQFRVPVPSGTLREELTVYEVVVRNAGDRSAVIEQWGFAARNGAVFYPPSSDWEQRSLRIPLSCPVPCRANPDDHAHRWYVRAGSLEGWCDSEWVRLEDVRPWIRRASDGKVVPARRWGSSSAEVDESQAFTWPGGWRRWPARPGWTEWIGYWRWWRRISRPQTAVMNPGRIPVIAGPADKISDRSSGLRKPPGSGSAG